MTTNAPSLSPIAPSYLPEPQSEPLRTLSLHIRHSPGEAWSSALGMSERTLNRHFQQQTGLRYGEWVRRARLLEALATPVPRSLCGCTLIQTSRRRLKWRQKYSI